MIGHSFEVRMNHKLWFVTLL